MSLVPKPFIRISVFGESNVGKSQLLQKTVHDTFQSEAQATIGVDQKRWKYQSTVLSPYLRVIAWDTAGHERFRTITRSYYRDVDGVLVCYEAMAPDALRLEQVRFWVNDIRRTREQYTDCCTTPILIVGTKFDDIDITDEPMEALARELDVHGPIFTSAMNMSSRELRQRLRPFCYAALANKAPLADMPTLDLNAGNSNAGVSQGKNCCVAQ